MNSKTQYEIPPGYRRVAGNQYVQKGDLIWTKFGWKKAGSYVEGRVDFYQCVIRKEETNDRS